LRGEVEALSFTSISLHGDTHVGNVMFADGGPVWGDLETACVGPLEWDLVQLPKAARAVFGPVDDGLLNRLGELRSATVAVWCWADAERSPEVRAAAEHHLARLKANA
jgi:aminoglycoside phosphotransferase (APT) family kinase protein